MPRTANGNVWYLGEDTREYENGEVSSTEGSWEAGVDGPSPRIMQAQPTVGEAYRQEYYAGKAHVLLRTLRQALPLRDFYSAAGHPGMEPPELQVTEGSISLRGRHGP